MTQANAIESTQTSLIINKIDDAILTHSNLGLMMIDLSDFTQINVGLGFNIGDSLLNKFNEKLTMLSCGMFEPVHYYGDKFVLIIPSLVSERKLERYASILINYFARNAVAINSLEVPVDIKISYIAANINSVGKRLLQSLEWSMRGLKKKNTHIEKAQNPDHFDIDSIYKKVSRYSVIRRAIENGELNNYYQPIIDLKTGKITACEALVRWENQSIGVMPPSSFLPYIAKHNQMINLTMIIVKNLIIDFGPILKSLPADFYITINLPPSILIDNSAMAKLITFIKIKKFPFSKIGFELTEQHLLSTPKTMEAMCDQLNLLGSKLFIDDFGTGHSSIERISSFPVYGIKVDKQFMLNKSNGELNKTVIRFALDVANHKNAVVICEGVADQESLDTLNSLGVRYGQGFLFSKAVNFESLKRLIFE